MTTINEDDERITMRFFSVLDELIRLNRIRGVKTFTDRYGINRRNLMSLRDTPTAGRFRQSWLLYLVRDYGVSADYLLTGEGSMFAPCQLAQNTTMTDEQIDELARLARSFYELAITQKVQNLCKSKGK